MLVDHVAIEVADFDTRLAFFVDHLGLGLRRIGRLVADPTRRIAMLADGRGVKVELVEGPPDAADRLLHLAFDAESPDGVDTAFAALVAAGCDSTSPPRRFEPARSRSAMVSHPGGGLVQIVAYDPDSPDAATPVAAASTTPTTSTTATASVSAGADHHLDGAR